MDIQKILELIEDAFESHVEAHGWNDCGTPMADLLGKEEMLSEIEQKLLELKNVKKLTPHLTSN